jgi:hypothetical protein
MTSPVADKIAFGPWSASEQEDESFLVFEENEAINAEHEGAGKFGTPKVCRIPAGPHALAYARAAKASPMLIRALDGLLEAMADAECAGRKYPAEALAAAKAGEAALAEALGHDWRETAS